MCRFVDPSGLRRRRVVTDILIAHFLVPLGSVGSQWMGCGIIRVIQALLGHDKLDTTARYTRVATGMIANVESPLAQLSKPHRQTKKPKLVKKVEPVS